MDVTHTTDHVEQIDKKRLRKGTHSCWECKRRKRRCIYGQDKQTCVGCRRYGLQCFSQDVPEAVLLARKGRSEISEQLSRVENILQNVMDKVNSGELDKTLPPPRSPVAPAAPVSPAADTVRPVLALPLPRAGDVALKPTAQPPTPAEALLAAFPCNEDYQTLMRASPIIDAISSQFATGEEADMLQLERAMRSSPPSANTPVPFPDASTHPVLLARQMLHWILFLQSPWHHRVSTFRENEWTLMERMIAAVRVVNGNDDLHGSLESLECMLLEAQCHLHLGNLRRSWVVNRRAMLLAQLMCVHRIACSSDDDGTISNCTRPPQRALDPRNVHRPDRMWSHILFQDRFLCMLLGLPQGSCDTAVVPCVMHPVCSSKRQASMQLECALSGVAARILERNERGTASARLGPEYSAAVLDAELLRAAQRCPPEFWDLPPFETMERYSLQDTAAVCQLLVQVFYFQLLNQLHLPYMLSFIHVGPSSATAPATAPATASASASSNDYAAISCTRASREILHRFLAYRRFNHTTACFRQVDFCAVPAVLTLLLAHLDVHLAARNRVRSAAGAEPAPSLAHKLIAHERSSDRALLKQVLERLEYVSLFNRDCMSSESAQLIRSLLAIEAKAAGEGGEEEKSLDGVGAMQIKITHLGLVYVSLDGRISKVCEPDPDPDNGIAAAGAGNAATPSAEPERSHWAKRIHHAPKGVFSDDAAVSLPPLSALPPPPAAAASEPFPGDGGGGSSNLMLGLTPYFTPRNLLPGPPTMPVSGPMLGDSALGWGPAITAGTNNWATQGVDMAFFEHLFMDPPNEQG